MNPSYTIDIENYETERIRIKYYPTKKTTYKILNLTDKTRIPTDFQKENIYRSVILSNEENENTPQLLSFSPPKSIETAQFIEENKSNWNDLYINEAIEGTMVHLFYDPRIDSWEIATKNAVGGNYWFFRNKYDETVKKRTTFYDMFLDALASDRDKQLNDVSFLKQLSKHYCYTFILQHPENHIVLTIDFAKLYLVAVYQINNNRVLPILPQEYESWKCFLGNMGIIHFPRTVSTTDYEEFEKKYNRVFLENSNTLHMGFMLTNQKTSHRTMIKNKRYEDLKTIRGNHPNLQYQYLSLYRIKKIKDYLQYFPMYKDIFFRFKHQYLTFIKNIHDCYCSFYIRKEVDMETSEISKKYYIHIWRLHHQIYIPSLRTGEKKVITKKVVKEYLDAMEPRLQFYYLNYRH